MKESDLIKAITNNQDRIIPIIGDNCFVGILEKDGVNKDVLLQEYIAEKLLGRAFVDYLYQNVTISNDYYYMTRICDAFQSENPREPFREKIKEVVCKGIEDKTIRLRNDVKKFLEIGRFDVIVTTSSYNILESELSDLQLCYNNKFFSPVAHNSQVVSRPQDKIESPTIYHIFGHCESEFVLTEEDLLKFLHYLNYPESEKGYGPSPLIKYIKEKSLLGEEKESNCILMPIGCDNLPNWLFRFLWYPLSYVSLFAMSKDSNCQGGVWYKYSTDVNFRRFLSDYNFLSPDSIKVDNDSNHQESDSFLAKLTEEMKSGCKKQIEKYGVHWQKEQSWDIFISYASDDKEDAKKIYDILTNKYKDEKKVKKWKVWMDNRIQVGEDYWKAIHFGIEHSDRCLFLITDNYLYKAINRYYIINGEKKESGVYDETVIIRDFYLKEKKDLEKINRYPIPLIKEGTEVEVEGEIKGLDGQLLEVLHTQQKYQNLRTDDMFKNTQAAVFNDDNIVDILKQLK